MNLPICPPAYEESKLQNWVQKVKTCPGKGPPTYPDNCNFFDMVLKALRLLVGIFLRHNPDQSEISEIQNPTVLMWNRKVSAWAKEKWNGVICRWKEMVKDRKGRDTASWTKDSHCSFTPPSIYTMKFVRRLIASVSYVRSVFPWLYHHTHEYIQLLFEAAIQGSLGKHLKMCHPSRSNHHSENFRPCWYTYSAARSLKSKPISGPARLWWKGSSILNCWSFAWVH